MTRRTLLWVPLAACLRAGDAPDIKELADSAIAALRNHDDKGFLAAFDPKMKGYRELAGNIHGLLRDADVVATIEISSGQMNWTLELAAHDLSAGVTRRQAETKYATEESGGKLRIVSFESAGLFAPLHGREAWDAISSVARDLQVASAYADPRQATPLHAAVDLPNLLRDFDRAMPNYAELEANLKALTSTWLVEPALQLTSNEGSDDRRALEIDWSMTLTDPQNAGHSTRKQATVKCIVEKRGKQWLIVSLAPLELFAPPQ